MNTIKKTSFLKLQYLIAMVLITQSVSAQTTSEETVLSPYKNQIGLQLNPYLDENLFRGFMPELVFGIRYAYHVAPHFSAGPEVNGFFPVNLKSGNDLFFFRLGAGAFARYSFFTDSRVRVFAEVLPYYSYRYWEENQWLPELRESRFGLCLSPGASLYSRSGRFSIDLYMKFSNIDFVNSKNYVFSYKVNYHF
jgi:hypothetical protein